MKVILKVCCTNASSGVPEDGQQRVLNVDKKKKQIALYEPVPVNSSSENPDERKHVASAPKLFAFDALFSEDDAQVSGNTIVFACFIERIKRKNKVIGIILVNHAREIYESWNFGFSCVRDIL